MEFHSIEDTRFATHVRGYRGAVRAAAWFCLLLTTLAILLMPVTFHFNDVPTQSLGVIANVPYFVAFLTVWVVLFLFLTLYRETSRKSSWEDLILVNLMVLVVIDFWVIITAPEGFVADFETGGLAYVQFIQTHGKIDPGHLNFAYFEYPLLPVWGAMFSEVGGVDTVGARTILLVMTSFLLASALYLFYLRFLGTSALAILATSICFVGNAALKSAITFHPAAFGIVLFVAFLLVLSRLRAPPLGHRGDHTLILMPLVVSAVHLVTSLAIGGVLGVLYVTQTLASKRFVMPTLVVLFLVVPLAWLVYAAGGTLEGVARLTELAFEDAGGLWVVGNTGSTFVGQEVPLWVSAVRLFWLIFFLVPAGVKLLLNLVKIRGLADEEVKATGIFLGIALFSGILVLSSPGGQQYYRFLGFGGFLAVLFTLKLLLAPAFLRPWVPRILALMVVVLFAPTLLAHNPNIAVSTWYPQEASASRFLSRTFPDGRDLSLSIGSDTAYLFLMQLPEASYEKVGRVDLMKDKRAFSEGTSGLVDLFQRDRESRAVVFVNSPRFNFRFAQPLGIRLTDPIWTALEIRLSGTNKVYDNGFSTLYR